ncbi:SMI1/KNR4 family protein [Amycolatopsis sp. WGS_07]
MRKGREWANVERKLGTSLPADYKALLSRFPSGSFRGAVFLRASRRNTTERHAPVSADANRSMIRRGT